MLRSLWEQRQAHWQVWAPWEGIGGMQNRGFLGGDSNVLSPEGKRSRCNLNKAQWSCGFHSLIRGMRTHKYNIPSYIFPMELSTAMNPHSVGPESHVI